MKNKIIIVGLAIVFVIAIIVVIYPFLPLIRYHFSPKANNEIIPGVPETQVEAEKEIEEPEDIASGSQINTKTEVKSNLLIIPKIGVRMSIVEGNDESALNRGAWRMPETSTPDQGSNTVIAGHRWLYRPPSQKTFYLLDKLEKGDNFTIYWEGKEYNYKIFSSEVVEPTAIEVLNPTLNSIITLLTCTPLFSIEKRLIIKGELVE